MRFGIFLLIILILIAQIFHIVDVAGFNLVFLIENLLSATKRIPPIYSWVTFGGFCGLLIGAWQASTRYRTGYIKPILVIVLAVFLGAAVFITKPLSHDIDHPIVYRVRTPQKQAPAIVQQTAKADKTQSLTQPQKKEPIKPIEVLFESEPIGAHVRIGSEMIGKTPVSTQCMPGKATATIQLVGYKTETLNFTVNNKTGARLHSTLKRLQETNVGGRWQGLIDGKHLVLNFGDPKPDWSISGQLEVELGGTKRSEDVVGTVNPETGRIEFTSQPAGFVFRGNVAKSGTRRMSGSATQPSSGLELEWEVQYLAR